MLKLIRNIALFILPIVVILILIPVNKRQQYAGLKKDCFNHAIWIYDRIHSNTTPIDIAFIGSSQTINGIDDRFLTENLGAVNCVNLGYCRFGRNLQYLFIKDLIAHKKVKKIIVEVREVESRYSHPIFPFVGNSKDVLLANPFFNKDIMSDIWQHLSYKVELVQEKIFNTTSTVDYRKNIFGFAPHKDTAQTAYLDKIKAERSRKKYQLTKPELKFHNNFSYVYLKKIDKICAENSVELAFLFIPTYANKRKLPRDKEMYEQFCRIIIPPRLLLDNNNYWHDENHLNKAGAEKLTQWLSNEISVSSAYN